jgi:predicted TIM-barrel fold metal-dependent hydrolase
MIQFDCHAHVYEKVTVIDGARYAPERPAPLVDWLDHQDRHGIKGGVIVQVSFLGTDNSELCAALSRLDRSRFAGVCVVAMDVNDEELDRLAAVGVRGIRWNLVRGATVPDLRHKTTRALLRKLRDRDMHLELHLEGPRLAALLPKLTDLGVNIVVDHFGLPSEAVPRDDPLLRAVAHLNDRNALFFKFAAHYRMPFDIRPHAEELTSLLLADHVVWGSDWPHTQHETRASYTEVWSLSSQWRGLSDARAARILYGIG